MALTTQQSALVDDVLRAMDALDAPGSSITGSTGYVYEKLETAADEVILSAPREVVASAALSALDAVEPVSTASRLTIPLPAAFLRLVLLEVESWNVPAAHEDIVAGDSEVYLAYRRGDEEGDADHPAVFRTPHQTSDGLAGEALDCFPGGTLQTLLYVPAMKPESVPAKLREALVWRAAYYVLTPIDFQLAQVASARSEEALRIRALSATSRRTPREARIVTRSYRYL